MPNNISPVTHKPYHWGWATIFAIITLVTLAFRYALPVRDGDLWWHMVYGKYFLDNKTLIADHTLFSWTPSSNDTIYCTWLPDIFLYLLYKLTGLTGLFAFRYLCLLTLVLACWLYARKLKLTNHPLVWLIALIAVLMSYTAAFLKPEIFSFTLMTLTVWCWFHIRSQDEKGWGWCYLIPVIMLVWVNSHGGFIFGVAFLIVAAAGEVLNTWFSPGNMLSRQCRKHLASALALTGATPFFTPYGYHYPFQLFFSVLPTQENIAVNHIISAYSAPFESLTPYHNFGLYADCAIIIILALCFFNFKQKKIEWSTLLTNLCFALLYTQFLRTTFYWAPVFALSSIYMLHTVRFTFSSEKTKQIVRTTLPPAGLLLMLLLAGFGLKKAYCSPEPTLWMGFGISHFNPVEETGYIKKHFPDKRIGNTYNEGGYLLWKLWPENKVFIDPRFFPYKSWHDDFFLSMNADHIQLTEKFVKEYSTDIWLIGLGQPTPLLFFTLSPAWKLAYYGKTAAVFIKKEIKFPLNAPKVSPNIIQLKNLYTTAYVIAFSSLIQDWQTTDKLLSALQNNFCCGGYKYMYNWAAAYQDGVKSYWRGECDQSIPVLENLPPFFISADKYLVDCYSQEMAQKWQDNEDEKAVNFAEKTWRVAKNNVFAAYNLGITGWYSSLSDPENPTEWQEHLQFFLENTEQEPDLAMARTIAQQIMDGNFPKQTKPGLLVPGRPGAIP